MRTALIIFLSFLTAQLFSQSKEEIEVRETVDSFFRAFHEKDSVGIKKTIHIDIVLQTIVKNKKGKPVLKTENFNDFIKAFTSIPDSVSFQERLTSYEIKVNGAMANAWTHYEFWYQNKFSHCGVNSFQLFKDTDGWKIIYLIDTRRKTGCL